MECEGVRVWDMMVWCEGVGCEGVRVWDMMVWDVRVCGVKIGAQSLERFMLVC